MENKNKYNGWFVTAMATTGVAILAVVAALVVGIGFGVKNANLQADVKHDRQVIATQNDKLDKQDDTIKACQSTLYSALQGGAQLEGAYKDLVNGFSDMDEGLISGSVQKFKEGEDYFSGITTEDLNTCGAHDNGNNT